MPPLLTVWCHEAFSRRSTHAAERPSRPPSGGDIERTRHVRVQGVALMQANVPADRLRLVA
eukprot:4561751-Heterocapsa_arctica.AAC.1